MRYNLVWVTIHLKPISSLAKKIKNKGKMSVSKRKSDKLAAFKIGFGLSFTLQPFEVLRTRMVLQKEYGKRGVMGMFRLCKSILVKEGVLGFWRGSLL